MHTKSCWLLHLTGELLSIAKYRGLPLYSLICVTTPQSPIAARQPLRIQTTDRTSGLWDQATSSLLLLRTVGEQR